MNRPLLPACILLTLVPGLFSPAHAQEPLPPSDVPDVPAEASADEPAAVDPERVDVPLDDIAPMPPAPAAGEVEPLSARASKAVLQAKGLLQQSRFTEARAALDRALRYQPNHPEIHERLASLHFAMGNPPLAEIHAEKALEADPAAAEATYILGRCRESHGELTEAAVLYRTALRDADDQATYALGARFHLGALLYREGYLRASIGVLRAFVEQVTRNMDSTLDGVVRTEIQAQRNQAAEFLSSAYERLGQPEEAAATINELVIASPGNLERSARCARLWLRVNRPDRALKVLDAIQSSPASDRPGVFPLLLEVHEAAGTLGGLIGDLKKRLADDPDDVDGLMYLERALASTGDVEGAESVLRAYLDRHPDADVVRSHLLDRLASQGRWTALLEVASRGLAASPQRIAEYEEAARRVGRDADAAASVLTDERMAEGQIDAYLLGCAAAAAGRDAQALALLRRKTEASPAFAPARAALARLLADEFRYDEALALAGRRDPEKLEDLRLERVLGLIYARLDENDKAELHLRAAYQENRDDQESALLLARVLSRSEQTHRARIHLMGLLDRYPTFDEARELLGQIYLEEHKLEPAMEQFRLLTDSTGDPRIRARYTALLKLRETGDVDAYREALKAAIEAHGPSASLLVALAESYDESAIADTQQAYAQALALDPENDRAVVGLHDALVRDLQFGEAAKVLEAQLPRHPNRHEWRLELLSNYMQTLQFDKAIEVAEAQLKRDKLDPSVRRRYRLRISEALGYASREAERVERWHAWHASSPEDFETATMYGAALQVAKRFAEAVDVYEKVYKERPDNLVARDNLIGALVAAKRIDRAAAVVLDRMGVDPMSWESVFGVISLLLRTERTDAALHVLQNQVVAGDERERYQDFTYQVLMEADRFDDAFDHTTRLLDRLITIMRRLAQNESIEDTGSLSPAELAAYPDRPFAPVRLEERIDELRRQSCDALASGARYAEAIERIDKWMGSTRHPRVKFHYLLRLRQCQTMLGRLDAALASAEEALAMEDDNVGLNNDVAYTWIDRGIKLEEAERRIRFAVSRQPMEPAYLDTLGWLMYKKGAFEEAHRWLSRAAAFQSEPDGVILDHLGDACWRLGRSEEAVSRWEAALARLSDTPPERMDADSRRVLEEAAEKINVARGGGDPVVAGTAEEPSKNGDAD